MHHPYDVFVNRHARPWLDQSLNKLIDSQTPINHTRTTELTLTEWGQQRRRHALDNDTLTAAAGDRLFFPTEFANYMY
jgi:hypothetical protein